MSIAKPNDVFAIIRDTFAKFYLQARSPFVTAALVDIMTDALECNVGSRNDGRPLASSYFLPLLINVSRGG